MFENKYAVTRRIASAVFGCVMSINAIGLPHAAIIASSLLAAQQVAPATIFLSDARAKSANISDQSVNRSLKRDRLAMIQVKPKTDVGQSPNQKMETDCEPPIDIRGRCFA